MYKARVSRLYGIRRGQRDSRFEGQFEVVDRSGERDLDATSG